MKRIGFSFRLVDATRQNNFLRIFFVLLLMFNIVHCFSQIDTSNEFRKKMHEMRIQKIEKEKQQSILTANKTTYNNGMGGVVSLTPKVNYFSSPTVSITVIAGTILGNTYSFEYATDYCSTLGIVGPFPSGPYITSDGFYEWDVSYDNGVTWNLGDAGGGITLQLGTMSRSAIYRRYCFPWDWQGSITNNCGDLLSNNIFINVITAFPLTGGKISSSNLNIPVNTDAGSIRSDSSAKGGTAPYNYSWQKYSNGVWSVVAGAVSDTLNVGILTKSTAFKRKVIDAHGDSAFSNTITFLVAGTSLKAGLIGKSTVLCSGESTTIYDLVAACGGYGNLTYSWEYNIGAGWVAIPSSNTANLSINNITVNTKYRRKTTDESGNFVYCNEVEILVYPALDGGTITPATQTICSNIASFIPEELTFTDSSRYTTGTVTYQWQKSTSATGPWTDIAGVTGTTYRPKISTQVMYYRVVVTSSNCNMTNNSSVATVLVNNACRVLNTKPSKK